MQSAPDARPKRKTGLHIGARLGRYPHHELPTLDSIPSRRESTVRPAPRFQPHPTRRSQRRLRAARESPGLPCEVSRLARSPTPMRSAWSATIGCAHPELAPQPELRQAIENTIAAVKNFAADVHSGAIAPERGGQFRHLLVGRHRRIRARPSARRRRTRHRRRQDAVALFRQHRPRRLRPYAGRFGRRAERYAGRRDFEVGRYERNAQRHARSHLGIRARRTELCAPRGRDHGRRQSARTALPSTTAG